MKQSSLFYGGTLLSSVGSLVFSGALIPFLAHRGTDLATIGLVMGGVRLFSVAFVSVFGPLLEGYSPRKMTIFLECVGALAALGIWWEVSRNEFSLPVFCAYYVLRSVAANAQTPMKAKIAKALAGENQNSVSRHSTMLSNVTQGATLFAGLSTWFIIEKVNFGWIVLFDALTFFIAGIMLLAFPMPEGSKGVRLPLSGIKEFLTSGALNFYKFGEKWAYLDLLLAVVLAGTTMLWARLSGPDINMFPAFYVAYGLAVWVAGPLSRHRFVDRMENLQWVWLGVAYILLSQFAGMGLVTLAFSFLKDTIYWMILHRISAKVMHRIPLEYANASHAFRGFQMAGILSFGEYCVGAVSSRISIVAECGWRAGVCLVIFVIMARKARTISDA